MKESKKLLVILLCIKAVLFIPRFGKPSHLFAPFQESVLYFSGQRCYAYQLDSNPGLIFSTFIYTLFLILAALLRLRFYTKCNSEHINCFFSSSVNDFMM